MHEVRSYKPGHVHFLEARKRIGGEARWLHAAQRHFHDATIGGTSMARCARCGFDGLEAGKSCAVCGEIATRRSPRLRGQVCWARIS